MSVIVYRIRIYTYKRAGNLVGLIYAKMVAKTSGNGARMRTYG